MIESQLSRTLQRDRRRRRRLARPDPIKAGAIVVDVSEGDGRGLVLDAVLLWTSCLQPVAQRPDQRFAHLTERTVAAFGGLGPFDPPLPPDDLRHVVRANEPAVSEARDVSAALGSAEEIDRSPRRRD